MHDRVVTIVGMAVCEYSAVTVCLLDDHEPRITVIKPRRVVILPKVTELVAYKVALYV